MNSDRAVAVGQNTCEGYINDKVVEVWWAIPTLDTQIWHCMSRSHINTPFKKPCFIPIFTDMLIILGIFRQIEPYKWSPLKGGGKHILNTPSSWAPRWTLVGLLSGTSKQTCSKSRLKWEKGLLGGGNKKKKILV